jgi:NAD(P)-dependent dehydrogenase (short-subunit alcohol dehydrogenase family)
MLLLEGKSGIVTGASRGIGQATALAAAAAGATVLACARGVDALAETVELAEGSPGRIVARPLDVRDETAVAEAIALVDGELGGLDFIVNNAGICPTNPLQAVTGEEWDELDAVNVRGVLWGSKHAVGSMLRRQVAGVVVNVGSTASVSGWGAAVSYCMSKHAVLGLTRAIAADRSISSAGIRAVCVCPGDIATPLAEEYFESTGDAAAARAELESLNPVGTLGRPEEVAALIVFLCSGQASLINGAALMADNGQHALLL